MQKLGYIISKRPLKDIVDFVEVVKNEEQISDPTKPFLILGYENVKKMDCPFSILDKKLDEGVYWTFNKTENRVEYEKDILSFYDKVIHNAIKDIKYYYVDVYTLPLKKVKSLMSIIDSPTKKYIYIHANMAYVYYEAYVLGISLEMLSYAEINVKKIFKKLYSNKCNVVFTNDDFLKGKLRSVTANKRYIIPFFKSICEDAIT